MSLVTPLRSGSLGRVAVDGGELVYGVRTDEGERSCLDEGVPGRSVLRGGRGGGRQSGRWIRGRKVDHVDAAPAARLV